MSHYTELSPSLNALANKNEPTDWADSMTIAKSMGDRASVYGVQWGSTRTRVTCLSARSHTAQS